MYKITKRSIILLLYSEIYDASLVRGFTRLLGEKFNNSAINLTTLHVEWLLPNFRWQFNGLTINHLWTEESCAVTCSLQLQFGFIFEWLFRVKYGMYKGRKAIVEGIKFLFCGNQKLGKNGSLSFMFQIGMWYEVMLE